MAVTQAQLVAVVKVDGVPQATVELQKISGAVEETQGGFKKMLGNALSFAAGQLVFNAVGNAVGFLKNQLFDCLQESMDAQAGMAQTNKVLQSTHDASGMTANAIADLAGNLSHLTKFSDDTVQASENMLLTFTNIGKKVFPDATKTVLDMSQALGQDTKNSAIQLGKALNDPIAGITALSRVGVTFSQAQKDQIKHFMDTNQIAKAQGVILGELQKEFGGSAEAAGKTFGGQLAILQQRLSDVKQTIGDAILPQLARLLGFLNSNIEPAFDKLSKLFSGLQGAGKGIKFGDIGAEILKAYPGIQKVADIFKGEFSADLQFALKWGKQISQWFKSDMEPAIKQALPAFESLSKVLVNNLFPAEVKVWSQGQQLYRLFIADFIPIFEKVAPIVVKFAGYLANNLGKAIVFLSPYISQAANAIGQFAKEISDRVMPIVNNFFDQLNKNMPAIKAIWNATWPVMQSVLKGVWDIIVGVVKIAWASVSGLIKIGLDILSGNWKQAWNDLVATMSGIWGGIKDIISGALRLIIQIIFGKGADVQNAIIKPFQTAFDFVSGIFGNLGNLISTTLGGLSGQLHNLHFPGFASGVSNFAGGMAYVHAGEVITYLPPGSSVTPASQVNSMLSQGNQQPLNVNVYLDGARMTGKLMPHIAQSLRYGLGMHGV